MNTAGQATITLGQVVTAKGLKWVLEDIFDDGNNQTWAILRRGDFKEAVRIEEVKE